MLTRRTWHKSAVSYTNGSGAEPAGEVEGGAKVSAIGRISAILHHLSAAAGIDGVQFMAHRGDGAPVVQS